MGKMLISFVIPLFIGVLIFQLTFGQKSNNDLSTVSYSSNSENDQKAGEKKFDKIHKSTGTNLTKKGGICFRVDDDQDISKYLEYAALFNRYNQKFCFALNLNTSKITTDYINSIREIQSQGHEMMDHTPEHKTNCFTTILGTAYYINHPGVQRIVGNRIELKYADVNIGDAKRSGYVKINKDTVISTNGIFSSFSLIDCYLYFPSINKLTYINSASGWIDQNRVIVEDFWGNSLNLGSYENIQFYNFNFYNVHLTVDALNALADETIRLAAYYNLQRPYTWIQSGSYSPHVSPNEIKQACGDELGYKAAGSDNAVSKKVFNEFNSGNCDQFIMEWGDFDEDTWTLEQCEQVIANRIARHYISIGHSHFNSLLGGWSGYLDRTEQIIQWCIANNIPIKTYTEWTDILYHQIPDSYENIMPPLNVDLDLDNMPDGYNGSADGNLIKDDGIPSANDYCFSINKTGKICSISGLGGVEKGDNEFEIWTKGASDDFIEVTFTVGSTNFVYKFPAENPKWTKYDLKQSVNGNTSLNIPTNTSIINITINCSNYSSGTVKISGMKLSKLELLPVELSSFNVSEKNFNAYLSWKTETEVNNYGFEIERKNLSQPKTGENWLKIGFVKGHGNSNSPKEYNFLDNSLSDGTKFKYRLRQIDNDGGFEFSKEVYLEIVPSQYELYQNYPNPFNPATTIKYTLPFESFVQITIYTSTGKKIEEIKKGIQTAGNYKVIWHPKSLSSGVYFYFFTAKSIGGKDNFAATRKMLFMK